MIWRNLQWGNLAVLLMMAGSELLLRDSERDSRRPYGSHSYAWVILGTYGVMQGLDKRLT